MFNQMIGEDIYLFIHILKKTTTNYKTNEIVVSLSEGLFYALSCLYYTTGTEGSLC